MNLTIGATYAVVKTNGQLVTFTVIGVRNDVLLVLNDGVERNIYEVLQGGFLCYMQL